MKIIKSEDLINIIVIAIARVRNTLRETVNAISKAVNVYA
jgi:hypothetical protein